MRITSQKERQILIEGGKRLALVLDEVSKKVAVGVATRELDTLAEKLIREGGDKPAFKNYKPSWAKGAYPATLCTSVNDEIVHGIPSDYILKDGDVIGLDIGLCHNGLFVDMAVTLPVGDVNHEIGKLLEVTNGALYNGISMARQGNTIGDIGAEIEDYVNPFGYGVVRDLGGHGVGQAVHEEPYIPNFGVSGDGPLIVAGDVLALEPMFGLGTGEVLINPDGFTVRTKDGKVAAHFEHTILVTEGEPIILTKAN